MRSASKGSLAALAFTAALVLTGCGDDSARPAAQAPPATSGTSATSPSSTTGGATTVSSSTAATPTTARGTIIEVVYKDGKVQGAAKYSIKKGEQVTLKVTADITDEVHVHGYDKTAAVSPTNPAVLNFIADKQGKYEVEFEKKHSLIIELEVK